jgi:NDP-sugar pyrophosphorylase family protein
MQIVIPMSGFGERFRRAGYEVPKPLIEIDGKPIIAHVIDMFPGETDFLFICSGEHLDNPAYRMHDILRRYCPQGRIVSVAPHKLGPVHAVRQVEHLLDPARPVVVNYCDFTCYWDWEHFKSFVADNGCDGAIPAYRGFHPHTLGSTNYAYMLETDGWVQGIQEKQPYTSNRMQEYASSGTYYFSSASIMSAVMQETVERGLHIGGEYYVSLAYVPLLESGRRVAVYPLQHFMQWGTPDDVAEYRRWSSAFRDLARAPAMPSTAAGSLVIPMAGMGQRFADEGYAVTKPLIPVSGQPMVAQAVSELPPARHHSFVLRGDMPGHAEISASLAASYPGAVITPLDGVTEGQACSAIIGLDALGEASGPVTIGACDYGALYDAAALQALLDDPEVDLIVWGVRGHPNALRQPQMFGWIDAEAGRIRRISVKTPLASPASDPTVLGTFTFKRAEDCRAAVRQLIARDGRINGEFYLDSCINDAIAAGLRCHLFEVDHYLSWGTPNDLRTFEYWQSCFHKWDGHPYRLELDARVPQAQVAALARRYEAFEL